MTARDGAELPNVAEVLAPLLGKIPRDEQPLLIAMAERMAADRYRVWAAEPACEPHRAELLACAQREDEIADRVESLYPDAAAVQRRIAEGSSELDVTNLEATNRSVFADRPLRAQLTIQARGERLGASTWRAFAGGASSSARDVFHACAVLEEESAAVLESILSEWSSR